MSELLPIESLDDCKFREDCRRATRVVNLQGAIGGGVDVLGHEEPLTVNRQKREGDKEQQQQLHFLFVCLLLLL